MKNEKLVMVLVDEKDLEIKNGTKYVAVALTNEWKNGKNESLGELVKEAINAYRKGVHNFYTNKKKSV